MPAGELDRLRTVLLRLSGDRLVVYSDFYKIRVFDKSNQRSCSLYTLTSWIEAHDIHEVARDYHVNESPMKHHPWNFPGKYPTDGGKTYGYPIPSFGYGGIQNGRNKINRTMAIITPAPR